MKLLLCMPGKATNQRPFWESAFVNTGLDEHTSMAFQANGKWNNQYPEDLISSLGLDKIAEEQHYHSRVRLDNGYIPKPYTHTFLDYEPRKRDLSGSESDYMWSKLEYGFNETDEIFLHKMRRAVQKATGGLPYGMYRTPIFPKTAINNEEHSINIESPEKIVSEMDWVWMHCYPQDNIINGDIIGYWEQLTTTHAALKKSGKKVIPWIWPSYDLNTTDAVKYGAAVSSMLSYIPGIDTIGIWADMNQTGASMKQNQNMAAIAPYLKRIIDSRA